MVIPFPFVFHQGWIPIDIHFPPHGRGTTKNFSYISLPETNIAKMDGWNTSFLLGWPIFRGELSVLGSIYMVYSLVQYFNQQPFVHLGFLKCSKNIT